MLIGSHEVMINYLTPDVLSKGISKILIAWGLMELNRSICDFLLNPQLVHFDVPDLTQASPRRDSLSR